MTISNPIPHARNRRRHLSGLPGERTLLAWDRAALSLLGNGALLVMRDAGGSHPLRLAAAVIGGLLAAMCGLLARFRARALAHHSVHRTLAPPARAAVALAVGVGAMAFLEMIAILLD